MTQSAFSTYKQVFNTLLRSILAGFSIGIAGTVYLLTENKYIAAIMFGIGLFVIIEFKFDLYTGKTGYIPDRNIKYLPELLVILFGNFIGTFIVSLLIQLTKLRSVLTETAVALMTKKADDSAAGIFILAAFCGLLVYIAVECSKKSDSDFGKIFGIIFPVTAFVLCGFHHSIADSFYIFLSGISVEKIKYLMIVVLGNTAGSLLIPVSGKLMFKKEKQAQT